MYITLLEQYESAIGIESKQTRKRKCLSMRIREYNTYKGIVGEKKAKKIIRDAISQNKL